MKVYLCGPINGCTDEECKDWREAVKARLPNTLDPMRRDYRGVEDEKYEEIVEGDLDDIKDSDLLLVNCSSPSWGTAMEIRDAFLQDKPVIVVCPTAMKISPWLRYHSTRIVHSFDDAIAWIEDHG
jgi:nucleoside 2-deoxyribosyltransferase